MLQLARPQYTVHRGDRRRGKGETACVYRATATSGESSPPLVAKVLHPTQQTQYQWTIEREYEALRHLQRHTVDRGDPWCPHVIALVAPVNALNLAQGLVFPDLSPMVTLDRRLTSTNPPLTYAPEQARRELAIPLLTALTFLHAHGVVHNDVKPENVALGSATGHLTLFDLGFATILANPRDRTRPLPLAGNLRGGSPLFTPPELGHARPPNGTGLLPDTTYYPLKSDLWAAGCVLYAAVTGLVHGPLSTAKNVADLAAKQRAWSVRDADDAALRTGLRLVGQLLCPDPVTRPPAPQALAVAQDEGLTL
jgi:serine/threonine protein kinase